MYLALPFQASVTSALIGAYLIFAVGASLTWSSPVIPKLQDPAETPFSTPPSTDDITWISSLTLVGACFGSLAYSFLADHIGRRMTIMSMGFPMLISYLAMGFWARVEVYYVARLLIGLVVGGSMAVLPVYIAELGDKSNRAALFAVIGCGLSAGSLFSFLVGPFVNVNTFNILLSIFPISFLILFILFGDETAHYYISIGKEQEARETLSRLRPNVENTELELQDMKKILEEQRQGNIVQLLKTKLVLKALVISIGLLIFQQFSGINVFVFYCQTIFELSGSNLESKFCPMIFGGVQLLSSIISIYTSDRFKRKPILIVSSLGMMVAIVPLGVYCYFKDKGYNVDSFSFAPILCLTITSLMFYNGLGPIPYAIIGEVFPSRVKALGTASASVVNWILAFVLTKYFDTITQTLGLGPSFWLYGVFCGLCAIFVMFVVVETKNKTLEEIKDELSR